MGVRFACHACGRRLNVKQQLAGRRGRCPKCGVWFRVPTEDADTSVPVDDAHSTAQSAARPPAGSASDRIDRLTSPRGPVDQGPARGGQPAAERPGDPLRWIDEHPDAQWYVRPPSGGQYGPASGVQLRQWISEGRVGADSLLWRDGWPQWREATQIMPTRFVPAPAPPPIAPPPAVEAPLKQSATPQPPAAAKRLPTAGGMLGGTAAEATMMEQASAAASDRPPEPPGKVRRQRTSRRTMIVGVLLALSLLLLAALAVVLVLQPPAVEV